MSMSADQRPTMRRRIGAVLPPGARTWLRRGISRFVDLDRRPVRWGSLRRTEPVARSFGFTRGQPIDRYYIEAFLARQAGDIRGRVLEVKDAAYTERFGGGKVDRADVLDIDPANERATIVADLASDPLPQGAFDCIVLTQTLHLVYDFDAALRNLCGALAPGGVLLMTVPGITPIASRSMAHLWYWSFTTLSIRRLLEEHAPPSCDIDVECLGNVLSAIAFLEGVATDELERSELDVVDPAYQVIVTARLRKGPDATRPVPGP